MRRGLGVLVALAGLLSCACDGPRGGGAAPADREASGGAEARAAAPAGEGGPQDRGDAGAAPRSRKPVINPERNLRDLVEFMTGSFSSAAQAASQPDDYREILLHMVRIWPDRTDGYWLYVEQAAANDADRPYRQRVYRVTLRPEGGFESAVYLLPGDPLRFAGAWKERAKLESVSPADLVARTGCSIFLERQGERFIGATRGRDCPSDLRGATYATSEVEITATELRSWDRGFDANGKQVWGAEKGPYIFIKKTGSR